MREITSRRSNRHSPALLLSVASAVLATASACAPEKVQPIAPPTAAQRCEALAGAGQALPGMRILSAKAQAAGATVDLGFGGMKSGPLPAHCEITGITGERVGIDGDHYAIRFHLRLPEDWNGRFFFEGGGGTDGNLGSALGSVGFGRPPALAQGYAVVSGDSGHSNELNADPANGGPSAFGRDPEARANYGHAALKVTYDAARALIGRFYSRQPVRSYFAGCSKGGQEGLAFAERYPDAFDGILVGAPGMSLPKAALGHPWTVQAFAAAAGGKSKSVTPEQLAATFTDDDLKLARQAVLAACDTDDGLKDGIIGTVGQCSAKRVDAELHKLQCKGAKSASCLGKPQIAALDKFFAGPSNRKGEALYASFPWDGGLADGGWRMWTIGAPAGSSGPGMTSIAVSMGAGTLSEIFSTPPRVLPPGPQAAMDYLMAYDFDRDAPAIFATSAAFPRSAWEDINARSPNLDAFAGHGGKLIVYHGGSDPVFSLNDTLAWWREADARMNGNAASTVRVFPVPGMGHCAGGPATDRFDGFSALVHWVEQGAASDRIEASAGPATPWPGRKRPLCPYPAVPRYDGKGDIEKAESFVCTAPAK
ncbi:tannase/feruloyl esterase family alpha/beta hydrolase [Rhizomicrobium electricum]|nr:tannase/feruloyl esterase family alpha/beta hydrolase [Rhizomicrobium electricum]NIJ48003.1 feruloyl esterase [Rhizomicrobium electricum]